MDYTYTFKVIDRRTAESFKKLVNMLLDATVKVDSPEDENMTSKVVVNIKNKTMKKYELLATVADIVHAELMEIKADSPSS